MKYGPNTEKIEKIIGQLSELTPKQVEKLDGVWNSVSNADRADAWNAVSNVDWDAARDAAWDAARNAVLDAAWAEAWNAAWDAAWDAARNAVLDAAWAEAWNAARNAILALLTGDRISAEHFDTLYGPWESVMES